MGLASRRSQCCCDDGISRSSATCCQAFFMVLCDSQVVAFAKLSGLSAECCRVGDISKALAAVHGSSASAHGSCRRARPDPIARSFLKLYFSKGQAQQPHKLPVRAHSALLLCSWQAKFKQTKLAKHTWTDGIVHPNQSGEDCRPFRPHPGLVCEANPHPFDGLPNTSHTRLPTTLATARLRFPWADQQFWRCTALLVVFVWGWWRSIELSFRWAVDGGGSYGIERLSYAMEYKIRIPFINWLRVQKHASDIPAAKTPLHWDLSRPFAWHV